jgi:hypothetical protein
VYPTDRVLGGERLDAVPIFEVRGSQRAWSRRVVVSPESGGLRPVPTRSVPRVLVTAVERGLGTRIRNEAVVRVGRCAGVCRNE